MVPRHRGREANDSGDNAARLYCSGLLVLAGKCTHDWRLLVEPNSS